MSVIAALLDDENGFDLLFQFLMRYTALSGMIWNLVYFSFTGIVSYYSRFKTWQEVHPEISKWYFWLLIDARDYDYFKSQKSYNKTYYWYRFKQCLATFCLLLIAINILSGLVLGAANLDDTFGLYLFVSFILIIYYWFNTLLLCKPFALVALWRDDRPPASIEYEKERAKVKRTLMYHALKDEEEALLAQQEEEAKERQNQLNISISNISNGNEIAIRNRPRTGTGGGSNASIGSIGAAGSSAELVVPLSGGLPKGGPSLRRRNKQTQAEKESQDNIILDNTLEAYLGARSQTTRAGQALHQHEDERMREDMRQLVREQQAQKKRAIEKKRKQMAANSIPESKENEKNDNSKKNANSNSKKDKHQRQSTKMLEFEYFNDMFFKSNDSPFKLFGAALGFGEGYGKHDEIFTNATKLLDKQNSLDNNNSNNNSNNNTFRGSRAQTLMQSKTMFSTYGIDTKSKRVKSGFKNFTFRKPGDFAAEFREIDNNSSMYKYRKHSNKYVIKLCEWRILLWAKYLNVLHNYMCYWLNIYRPYDEYDIESTLHKDEYLYGFHCVEHCCRLTHAKRDRLVQLRQDDDERDLTLPEIDRLGNLMHVRRSLVSGLQKALSIFNTEEEEDGDGSDGSDVENLVVKGFETHGIQFNGFYDIELVNVEVGPTSDHVRFNGMSHNKFLVVVVVFCFSFFFCFFLLGVFWLFLHLFFFFECVFIVFVFSVVDTCNTIK